MNSKGFTLIELMMVLAIIGILAMIAVPAYQGSVQKSRRADAKAALSGLQMEMEKFRGSCTQYPTAIGNADDCAGRAIEYSDTSNDGYYDLSIVAANSTATAYKIEADPTGVQVDDTDCDPMSITVNNTYPKGLKAPADCW
jgi:type IV pilus assembly protein PilE